jgi:hypothetical protein
MRKAICSLALIGLLGLGMSAFAQDNSQTAPPPMQGPRGAGFSPERQLAHLTKALNLTSDQQSQIKPLLENQHQQMTQLHDDQSLSSADRMAKAKSLHEETTSKIEAVLNDQQKQKYEAMQQQMQEHRHGGGQPQAQPQQ